MTIQMFVPIDTPLNDVELKELNEMSMFEEVMSIKRRLIKLGFEHQLAFYGVLVNKETGKATYKRIDVLLDSPVTLEIFTRIYDYIEFIKPNAKYSVWAYSDFIKVIKDVLSFID